MRRLFSSLLILAMMTILSACYHSFHQAWLEGDVVKMNHVAGLWHVHRYGDAKPDELPKAAWHFSKQAVMVTGQGSSSDKEVYVPGFTVDVIDENGRTAGLDAVFFKLGIETYVETIVDRVPMNELARLHVMPMRQVARVKVTRKELSFYPLNMKKLRELGVSGKKNDGTDELNFRKTKEWQAILLKHGPALFDHTAMFVLKRKPISNR